MKILITGTAGFIGFHLAEKLLQRGDEVVGLDNINSYYDVNLKYDRLSFSGIDRTQIVENKCIQSSKHSSYRFIKMNLEDKTSLVELFRRESFDQVIHLAAQAGVRYSLSNPNAYIESNIIGFINILECCREFPVNHLTYASSSSVYGLNKKQPFSTNDTVDHPISLYAASKKSNELMAHTYSHLFKIPTTGLRFFTVYGPWGRPDMALFLFTKAMYKNKAIDVYNYGDMSRDFTYIDDIIEGVIKVNDHPPTENSTWDETLSSESSAAYKIYNIGNNNPVPLIDFIDAIEKHLGKKAEKNLMPIQPGDVPSTYADVSDLIADFDYKPKTSVNKGVSEFISWYKSYYSHS